MKVGEVMLDPGAHPGEVSFGNDLSIRNISSIHAQMMNALLSHDNVVIRMDDECDVDISFIQSLVAAHIQARSTGKTIQFSRPPSGKLLEALVRGGFMQTELSALWAPVEKPR